MENDPGFPWDTLLMFAAIFVTGWYAGQCNDRMVRYRQAARALWYVCHQARERGVFFSAWDKAIIEETRKLLK
jgi:hypothetical protein